jgi:hypothetical protein
MEGATGAASKKRKRGGKGSNARWTAKRKASGLGPASPMQKERLRQKLVMRYAPPLSLAAIADDQHSSDVLQSAVYSVLEDASVSKTGWQGCRPPQLALDNIISRYRSGEITKDLATFHKLPYGRQAEVTQERPAFVLDCHRRVVLTRSPRVPWMGLEQQVTFTKLIHELVDSDISDEFTRLACRDGSRGSHLVCIMGYQRQSRKVSEPNSLRESYS